MASVKNLSPINLSEATDANFQNDGEIWILYVDKTLLFDRKKYCSSKAMAW